MWPFNFQPFGHFEGLIRTSKEGWHHGLAGSGTGWGSRDIRGAHSQTDPWKSQYGSSSSALCTIREWWGDPKASGNSTNLKDYVEFKTGKQTNLKEELKMMLTTSKTNREHQKLLRNRADKYTQPGRPKLNTRKKTKIFIVSNISRRQVPAPCSLHRSSCSEDSLSDRNKSRFYPLGKASKT